MNSAANECYSGQHHQTLFSRLVLIVFGTFPYVLYDAFRIRNAPQTSMMIQNAKESLKAVPVVMLHSIGHTRKSANYELKNVLKCETNSRTSASPEAAVVDGFGSFNILSIQNVELLQSSSKKGPYYCYQVTFV